MVFTDKLDFEEQQKGVIAAPEYKEIMADEGHVAWSIGKYEFLLGACRSINSPTAHV